jgi:chloramphenicol 3-O-phosphotransferase
MDPDLLPPLGVPTGGTRLPVLWLYGPSGVGKTTVAWELFAGLARDGTAAGYVDIDQLGMCYAAPTPDAWAPEPASDPGRHRLKIRNLDAVLANFRVEGARCVVVSGVVDTARGVDPALLPRAALTLCRLRGEPSELRRRLTGRGRPSDRPEGILRDAEALDRNGLPGACVDTTGRGVDEVLRLVRDRTGGWPGPAAAAVDLSSVDRSPVDMSLPRADRSAGPGRILWLCGAAGVGKSSVGWEVYQQVRRAGVRAAFVDLEQVGFHRPTPAGDPGGHRLRAANLAALWRNYRAGGTRQLIAVGPVGRSDEVRRYTDALPGVEVTVCRLHADRDRLTERIMRRGRGLGSTWGMPGDPLRGQPDAVLRQAADAATADASALEAAAIGDSRIDTSGRPVPELAREILLRTGWAVG